MIGTRVFTILRSVDLLSELTDRELAKIWEASQLREFSAGTEIMKSGATGDSMYFFLEGAVDVWPASASQAHKTASDQNGKPLVRLKAEMVSLFGEMAMLSNEPRSATISAASDCVLYEITRTDFTTLCEQDPVLGLKLMRGIAIILSGRVRKGNTDQIKLWKALSKAAQKDPVEHD